MTTSSTQVRKVRFSLRELLVATALVAAGFTWPMLLVFVVPLLAVVGLSHIGNGFVAPFVAVAMLSLVLGVIYSQLYWRYPFVEPPVLEELGDIKSVEQLSSVAELNPERGLPATSALHGVMQAREPSWTSPGTDRVLGQLIADRMEIRSAEPVSDAILNSIWNAAEASGLLVSGDPGYSNTKTLSGYVGIARLNGDSRVAFATLLGGEHSNDHYPYYEFVLRFEEDGLAVINSRSYFVDIAGIEGMNWLSFATMSFIFMLPLVIVFEIVWTIWAARKRGRQKANST